MCVFVRPQGANKKCDATLQKRREEIMALSSINIKKGEAHYLAHNTRANYSKSVVFFDEENDYMNDRKTAFQIYRNELQARSKEYSDRTKQALQKNTITHLSAVVNLDKGCNKHDVENLIHALEKDLDTKVFNYSIHRDEGYLIHKKSDTRLTSGIHFFANPKNKKLYHDSKFEKELNMSDFEVVKNYHAHIEFMGLDSKGNSVRKKLTRKYLSELQTKTAEILFMERGERKGVKRLEINEFKRTKAIEEQTKLQTKRALKANIEELATLQDIKRENARLRRELQESKATRKEYAELEKIIATLKEEVRKKELTVSALKSRLDLLDYMGDSAEQIRELERKMDNLGRIKNLAIEQRDEAIEENTALKERISGLQDTNQKLEEENRTLKNVVDGLKNAILTKPIQIVELFTNELSRYFKMSFTAQETTPQQTRQQSYDDDDYPSFHM